MVVFLRQRVDAGEDAVGGLEAGAAVVPVYAKERVLGFLPGIKVVSISRICNRNGNGLSSSIRRFLYKTPRFLKIKSATQHPVWPFFTIIRVNLVYTAIPSHLCRMEKRNLLSNKECPFCYPIRPVCR